jgi:hypothetical protein
MVPASVVALAAPLSLTPLRETLQRAFVHQAPTYQSYLFLPRLTAQYDVVFSDIRSSWIVPTFGGKVVATGNPLPFVPDQDVRRSDVDRFFSREATLVQRQEIIQKYNANYLLLKKGGGRAAEGLQQPFLPGARVEFESDGFVLISLKPDFGKNVPAGAQAGPPP